VPQNMSTPIVLAGGLVPSNVAQAVQQVRPYAVDVSGGVESAPGKKDRQKTKEFIDNVRRVNAQRNNPNEDIHGE